MGQSSSQTLSNHLKNGLIPQATYEGATVFTSLILITVFTNHFALIRIVGNRKRLLWVMACQVSEKKLSYQKPAATRNSLALLVS